ncbi:ATP-binding protein [Paenibacillus sp. TRM 82003]|uniref:ATP-binding protein n=1 Tax=Kineococcus sp. TRM81007 TaxID=2925831 RepID=UPI001F5AA703|nr:ATP-binding protein [Kineococcus sp. TRM81007]MCI2240531.1 ATP-binding protein [Kineococcus sp. TRM81007]MCI3918910.1 ATP-binding protein [Paenibacillus sp. TRM 82003]
MCDVTPAVQRTLAPHAESARQARRFLEENDCPVHHSRVLDEAELLTTELVTNAVAHGGPPITLRVTCDGTPGMAVAVSDGSSEPPVAREASPEATSGRGVALVDLLSDAWGVETADTGKEVWFRLSP